MICDNQVDLKVFKINMYFTAWKLHYFLFFWKWDHPQFWAIMDNLWKKFNVNIEESEKTAQTNWLHIFEHIQLQ